MKYLFRPALLFALKQIIHWFSSRRAGWRRNTWQKRKDLALPHFRLKARLVSVQLPLAVQCLVRRRLVPSRTARQDNAPVFPVAEAAVISR
jgi:hypothetical protein